MSAHTIRIMNRKPSLNHMLKWESLKYDFRCKRKKLPKKTRNLRFIPLPQQQGTKKVREMGNGT